MRTSVLLGQIPVLMAPHVPTLLVLTPVTVLGQGTLGQVVIQVNIYIRSIY